MIVSGLVTPLDESVIVESFSGELAEGFRGASHAYPMSVRIFAIILNSVRGIVLIGEALFSFARDRSRTYNLLIVIGGILPMVGGTALGFFGDPNIFFEFELGGVIFLFLGFIFSSRYLSKIEAAPTVSK